MRSNVHAADAAPHALSTIPPSNIRPIPAPLAWGVNTLPTSLTDAPRFIVRHSFSVARFFALFLALLLPLSLFSTLAVAARNVLVINPGGGSLSDGSDGLEITLDKALPQMQVKSKGVTWFKENAWASGGTINNGIYISAPTTVGGVAVYGPNAGYGPIDGYSSSTPGAFFTGQAFASASTSAVTQTTQPSGKPEFSVTQTFTAASGLTMKINWSYAVPNQYIDVAVTLDIPATYSINGSSINGSNPVRYYHAQQADGMDTGCSLDMKASSVFQIGAYAPKPSSGGCTAAVPTSATRVVWLKGNASTQAATYYSSSDIDTGILNRVKANLALQGGRYIEGYDAQGAMGIEFRTTKTGGTSFSYQVGYQAPQTLDHFEIRHTGKASVLCGSADINVVACTTSEVPCKDWNRYTETKVGHMKIGYGVSAAKFTPSEFDLLKGESQITIAVKGATAGTIDLGLQWFGSGGFGYDKETEPMPKNKDKQICVNTLTGSRSCDLVVDDGSCMGFECIVSGQAYTNPKTTLNARNPLLTQLVGETFAVDIVALDLDGNVKTGYVTPSTGTDTVRFFSDTRAPNKVCPTTAQPVIQTPATLSLNFTAADKGRKTVSSITIPQAYGKVSCQVVTKDTALTDTSNNPLSAQTFCSSDAFTVRPKEFTTVSGGTSSDSSGINSSDAPPPHTAGKSFTLSAFAAGYTGGARADPTKIEWPGAPANGIPAPGVGNLRGYNKNQDASGNPTGTPVLDNPVFEYNAQSGTTSGTFIYDDVGYFRFKPYGVLDDKFVEKSNDKANVDCITGSFSNTRDINGKYGCGFGNATATNHIGRFAPNHFKTEVKQGCARNADPTKHFTYARQPFEVTVTALNLLGNVTKNYASQFADDGKGPNLVTYQVGSVTNYGGNSMATLWPTKLSGTSFKQGVGKTGVSATGTPTDAALLTIRSDNGYETSVVGGDLGTGSPVDLRVRAKGSIYNEDTSSALQPGESVADGELYNYPGGAEGIVKIRKGRTRITTQAIGSDKADLKLLFVTEYMKGGAWVTNTDDDCTGYSALDVSAIDPALTALAANATYKSRNIKSLSNAVTVKITPISSPAISTCVLDNGSPGLSGVGCTATDLPAAKRFKEATASVSSFAGDFNLWLKAPGARGSVKVEVDVPDWLKLWPVSTRIPEWANNNLTCVAKHPGSATTCEPEAIVNFGIHSTPWIYRREVY